MVFKETHWKELTQQGYTIVARAIDDQSLRSAQDAASYLNAIHPNGGWERSRNELWRDIRSCANPEFLAIVTNVLDPLALEILEQPARSFDRHDLRVRLENHERSVEERQRGVPIAEGERGATG